MSIGHCKTEHIRVFSFCFLELTDNLFLDNLKLFLLQDPGGQPDYGKKEDKKGNLPHCLSGNCNPRDQSGRAVLQLRQPGRANLPILPHPPQQARHFRSFLPFLTHPSNFPSLYNKIIRSQNFEVVVNKNPRITREFFNLSYPELVSS